jgi:hypothetical protein
MGVDNCIERRRDLKADVYANNRVVVAVISNDETCRQCVYDVQKLQRNGYQAVLLHSNPDSTVLPGILSRGSWSTILQRCGVHGVAAIGSTILQRRSAHGVAAIDPAPSAIARADPRTAPPPPTLPAVAAPAPLPPLPPPSLAPPPLPVAPQADADVAVSVMPIPFHVFVWLKKFARQLDGEARHVSGGALYARHDIRTVSLLSTDGTRTVPTVCMLRL